MAAEREDAKLEVEPPIPEIEAPSVAVAGDTLRGSVSYQKEKKYELEYVHEIKNKT